MRNLTEIYSQIAADSTTRCSHNSVIFTTAIDFEIKCRTGYAYQRETIFYKGIMPSEVDFRFSSG